MVVMLQTEHSLQFSQGKPKVCFFGSIISPHCFAKIMKFGIARLWKLLHGRLWDARRSCFRRLTAPKDSESLRPQRHACNLFLLNLYIRMGETLPDMYVHKYSCRRHRRIAGEDSDETSGDDDVDDIASGDLDRDLALQLLGDRSMWTRYCDSGCGEHIAQLPKRTLPPGNVKQLWEEFRNSCHPALHKCPSIAVFYKAWEDWHSVLSFRGISHFADCDDCHRLRQTIARSMNIAEKTIAVKELMMHRGTIMKCRRIEESLRASPPSDYSLPVLVIWTDGMDQAHWNLPREAGHCAPRDWAKYQRPRAKVQGCWVFWWGVTFFIADHCMPHDSSMTCEVIARALEKVKTIALRKRIAVPPELILWTDNTPRENKNSIVIAYLVTLIAKGMFRFTALMNFPKGHSHGILDQLFGIIARAMRSVRTLRDVLDLVEKIESFLRRRALREWFGEDTKVDVVWLTSVRDWKRYFQALRIKFEGGMKYDVTAIHCWMFMFRKDLPANVRIVSSGVALPPHPLDVIAVTKRWVTDAVPCQDPTLVLPYSRLNSLPPVSTIPLRPPNPVPADLASKWLTLAGIMLQRFGPIAQRSADYLHKLSQNQLSRGPLPTLHWHNTARQPAALEEAIANMGSPVIVQEMWPAAQFIARVRP